MDHVNDVIGKLIMLQENTSVQRRMYVKLRMMLMVNLNSCTNLETKRLCQNWKK